MSRATKIENRAGQAVPIWAPDNNIQIGGRATGEASELQSGGQLSTDINDAQPGDAIFWSNSAGDIVHAGIVVDVRDGKVYFVHAPRPGKNVNRFYVRLTNANLGGEKFAGVDRPIEALPTQRTSTVGRIWQSVVQWWNSWSLFPDASAAPPKPTKRKEKVDEAVCYAGQPGCPVPQPPQEQP